MSEISKNGTNELALTEIISRPNAVHGHYEALGFVWSDMRNTDAVYVTHLANQADRIIQEAIEGGKDMDDPKTIAELRAAFHGAKTGAKISMITYKFLRLFGFCK